MKTLICIGFLVSIYFCHGQANHPSIMHRYWNYRYQLIGDDIDPNYEPWEPGLLQLGVGPGCSMPANFAYPPNTAWGWEASNNNWSYAWPAADAPDPPQSCANQNFTDANGNSVGDPAFAPFIYSQNPTRFGKLEWGDAEINLGKYLIVLASEYNLLKNQGYDTKETEIELYYAIKAAIRIDENAEMKFGFSTPQTADGYFWRDDVPADFAYDESRFGNRYHWVTSAWSCELANIKQDGSAKDGCSDHKTFNTPILYHTYTSPTTGTTYSGNTFEEESIDNAIYLLAGLHYVAQTVGTLSNAPEPFIVDDARQQICRIINYMCSSIHPPGLWTIYNPAGNRVCRGATAFAYASAFMQILNQNNCDMGLAYASRVSPFGATQDAAWYAIQVLLNMNGLQSNPSYLAGPSYNTRMALYVAAMHGPKASDGIIYARLFASWLIGPPHTPGLPGVGLGLGVSRKAMKNFAWKMRYNSDFDEAGTLTRDFSWLDGYMANLHGYAPKLSLSQNLSRLNQGLVYQCRTPNPFLADGPTKPRFSPALDYMIINNLMRLNYSSNNFKMWDLATGQYKTYNDMLHRKVNVSYPIGTMGLNTNPYPLLVQSAYTMELENVTIQSNAKVNFRAPHIIIPTGSVISALPGSVATFLPDRMECTTLNPNPSGKTGEDEFIEPDSDPDDEISEADSIRVSLIADSLNSKYFVGRSFEEGLDMWVNDLMKNQEFVNELAIANGHEPYDNPFYLTVFPNPTKGVTSLTFYISESSKIHIELRNSLGVTVKEILSNEMYPYGENLVRFNTGDLPAGTYTIMLTTNSQTATKTLIINQ